MSIVLEYVAYTYMPGTPFEQQALKDVSATIEQGSLTAIAGHTGSGKSTLLQQFNGLLQPTAGRVLVDGVDINPKAKKERAAARNSSRPSAICTRRSTSRSCSSPTIWTTSRGWPTTCSS